MTTTINGVTEAEWNHVRSRFRGSIMAKTEIAKLAQNIGATWPLKGPDEIPLKYIPHSLDGLMMMPGIGDRPERIRLLIEVLNETMAFDDPFSEMAEQVDSSSKSDDRSRQILEQLEVPLNYPLRLCALSPETQDFCADEEISTIGEFAQLAQKMAQAVVVGGDFRAFLNTMAHPEESSIARFVPLRPGKKGLHLAEALGQQATQLPPADFQYFLERGEARSESARDSARKHTRELLEWFSTEAEQLRAAFTQGQSSVERFFVILDNPDKERVAAALARLVVEENKAAPQRGVWSRLFKR